MEYDGNSKKEKRKTLDKKIVDFFHFFGFIMPKACTLAHQPGGTHNTQHTSFHLTFFCTFFFILPPYTRYANAATPRIDL